MNIKELREKVENLSPLPDDAPRFSWLAWRIDLRNKILNDDPREFLTWPVIKATMFVGDAPFVRDELMWLSTTWWKRALEENNFGNPETFYYETFHYYPSKKTSGNLVNQTYYVKRWEYASYMRTDGLKNIVEFGGGYGLMALICQRFGFAGQYTIIDFPEYLLLQEYYLSNVLDDISNIQFISTFDDYEIDADLMISICSLSEIDEAMKDIFFEQVKFKHHLIVFQPDYQDWHNTKYFVGRVGGEPFVNPYYKNLSYLVR